MSIITLLAIAFGLSMDAFAVSVSNGAILRNPKVNDAIKTAGYFGFFQALMPLLGWLLGIRFSTYIKNVDHWIAFLLLFFIGAKMIYETLNSKDEDHCINNESKKNIIENKTLFLLAIATSIDALAVGVSFAFLKVKIISSILIIGAVTFVICFAGVFIGKKFCQIFKKKAELLGGTILILIGLKILLEHTQILSLIFK